MDLRKGFHEPSEKPRRFYKEVSVAPVDDGFAVLLDARRLKTPQGALMRLPTAALADQVAEEWAEQGDILELATMHATRLANTAIETIGATREAVADEVESLNRQAKRPIREFRLWEKTLRGEIPSFASRLFLS